MMKNVFLSALSLLLLWHGSTLAQEKNQSPFVEINVSKTINQHWYSNMACGPAAVLMLYANSPEGKKIFESLPGEGDREKLQKVIQTYGKVSSDSNPNAVRFNESSGINPDDLLQMAQEIQGSAQVKIPLRGNYIIKRRDENKGLMIERVHQMFKFSLERGVPVVINLLSFYLEMKLQERQKGIFETTLQWQRLKSHFIVVTKIHRNLGENDFGFFFEYIDPNGGTINSGYLYAATSEPFNAPLGIGNSTETYNGDDFLRVIVPTLDTLGLDDIPEYSRAVITLNHAIGRLDR